MFPHLILGARQPPSYLVILSLPWSLASSFPWPVTPVFSCAQPRARGLKGPSSPGLRSSIGLTTQHCIPSPCAHVNEDPPPPQQLLSCRTGKGDLEVDLNFQVSPLPQPPPWLASPLSWNPVAAWLACSPHPPSPLRLLLLSLRKPTALLRAELIWAPGSFSICLGSYSKNVQI